MDFGDGCFGGAPCASSACTSATHVVKGDLAGLYCAGASCVEGSDKGTCCVEAQTCAAGFQLSSESEVTGKIKCDEVKTVSSTARCAGPACVDGVDNARCCVGDGLDGFVAISFAIRWTSMFGVAFSATLAAIVF